MESQPGQGSRFSFSVLLDSVEGRQAESWLPSPPETGAVWIWNPDRHALQQISGIARSFGLAVESLPDLSQAEIRLRACRDAGSEGPGGVRDLFPGCRLRSPGTLAILAVPPELPGIPSRADSLIAAAKEAGIPVYFSAPTISHARQADLLAAGAEGFITAPYRPSEIYALFSHAYRGIFPERKPAAHPESDPELPMAWPVPPRILLVDDHPVNLEVAKAMLKKLGCTVEAVEDGLAALAAVRERPIDLLFMDCEMPGMDGFEATTRIRALEADTGRIPIIALTAHAVAGARERCLASGMDDYISKPFTVQALSDMLMAWIKTGGSAARDKIPPPAPEGSPDKDSGPLDVKRLQAFGDSEAQKRNVLRLVGIFIDSTQASLRDLRVQAMDSDSGLMARSLHRLRGGCLTVGAREMAGIVQEMETSVQAGATGAGLTVLLERLETSFQATVSQMEAYVGLNRPA